MKKSMAFLSLFASIIIISSASAQLRSPQDNAFQADLENVILDYPNSFQHYIGGEIMSNPQSVDYSSLLKIRGAEECTITKYAAKKNSRYSYQAIMLTTNDFEKAKEAYDTYYSRLDKLNFRFANQSCNLTGTYEQPAEGKKFTMAPFSVTPAGEGIRQLRVELLMEHQLQWKVKVLVYNKEGEDDERGKIKDN